MSALSEIPFEKAFVAINGEFAWRRKDIDAALTAICNSGHATLRGEVWLITGEHSWDGLIPKRGGDPPAVLVVGDASALSDESWRDYCHRTAVESKQTVGLMSVESETPPEFIENLRFNVTYVAQPPA